MVRETQVVCLGISHHTAPVKVRESLGPSDHKVSLLLGAAAAGSEVTGLVVVATCNRIEFYASAPVNGIDAATRLKTLLKEVDYDPGRSYERFYTYAGVGAARHLATVAAGLDSVVLGEAQVLGQLMRAVKLADEHGALDEVLRSLFRFGTKAGKRARAETGINKNPVSVSSVAVAMAERRLGSLDGKTVAIVGLGEMGRLAVKAVGTRRTGKIILVNRTVERANKLAEELGVEPHSIEDLEAVVAQADVVISATGCPNVLIDRDLVERAISQRQDRPLVMLDIAVPHDVDHEVGTLPNVDLASVDDLQDEVNISLSKRRKEIPAVEAILADEVQRFSIWYQQSTVRPLIADMRRRAEQIRSSEIQRFLKNMPELDHSTQEELELFTQSLVKKLFHTPTERLREEAVDGDARPMAEALRTLFSL